MAVTLPNPEIEKLLVELSSAEADRREAAAAKIEARELRSDEIVKALEASAKSDPILFVRQAARAALTTIGTAPPPPAGRPDIKPARRAWQWSRGQKIRDFLIRSARWFLVNLALSFLWGGLYVADVQARVNHAGAGEIVGLLLFPVNVLIVLARIQRWVALGMLSAMAASGWTWFIRGGWS